MEVLNSNSKEKIEMAFIKLIQTKKLDEISVISLVKKAGVNRSTFYTNYVNIYDLADKIKEKMFHNLLDLYKEESIKQEHSYDYLKLFKHIKDNQSYYIAMFKLNFDFMNYYDAKDENYEAIKYYGSTKNIDYHIVFFKAGISAIIKKWLMNGCLEEPEDMVEVINSEYNKKSIF